MLATLMETSIADTLCVADSKWVLGHWYIKVMMNGRSGSDFCTLAGLAQEELGHVRALFHHLEQSQAGEIRPDALERDRLPDQCFSMELLDRPPRNWADLVVSMLLAETAIDTNISHLPAGRAPAGLWEKVRQEDYFHFLAAQGWLGSLGHGEREQARESFSRRFPLAVSWFGGDPGGWARAARAEFVARCRDALTAAEVIPGELFASALARTGVDAGWDPRMRRHPGPGLPPRLWQSMVPTGPAVEVARRPREVNLADNFSTHRNSHDPS
jgi:1,2-phenylacetyl-CoA epoxidase catalytic subunit